MTLLYESNQEWLNFHAYRFNQAPHLNILPSHSSISQCLRSMIFSDGFPVYEHVIHFAT